MVQKKKQQMTELFAQKQYGMQNRLGVKSKVGALESVKEDVSI